MDEEARARNEAELEAAVTLSLASLDPKVWPEKERFGRLFKIGFYRGVAYSAQKTTDVLRGGNGTADSL